MVFTNFKNFDEFANAVSKSSGTSIDNNTYDYDILKAIYSMTDSVNASISSYLKSLNYENKSGYDLDKQLNFFNVYRRKGNTADIYSFTFLYTGNDDLLIKKDGIIRFDGFNYKVVKDAIFQSKQNGILYAVKTFSNYNFKVPIFSTNGYVMLEKKDCECGDQKETIENILPSHFKLISFKHDSDEVESDLLFLERGKSLLQSFGFSNNKKIESELRKDSRIKGVFFNNQNGLTTITIFPSSYKVLDEAIAYANEVTQYYKDSNIKVIKPNLIEININGVSRQLVGQREYENIMNDIVAGMKEYLSGYLINNSVDRTEMIDIIKKQITKYTLDFQLNENTVYINVFLYWHENYINPIMVEEISDKLNIGMNNIITFGKLD